MAPTAATATNAQTSALLGLPPELLQRILFYIHDSAPVLLHPKSKDRLLSPALATTRQVCRQLHAECHAGLFRLAAEVEVIVQDFNFQHLTTFLARIEEGALRSFVTKTTASKASAGGITHTRRLHVHLEISPGCEWTLLGSPLQRWIQRAVNPAKYKGADIHVQYTAVPQAYGWPMRGDWLLLTRDYVEERKGQPDGDEMEKILQAILQGVPREVANE